MDEIKSMTAGNTSSEEEDEEEVKEHHGEGDIEKSGTKNKIMKIPRKSRYVCKFNLLGQRIKIDHCLAMRMLIAAVMISMISMMMYILYNAENKRSEKI